MLIVVNRGSHNGNSPVSNGQLRAWRVRARIAAAASSATGRTRPFAVPTVPNNPEFQAWRIERHRLAATVRRSLLPARGFGIAMIAGLVNRGITTLTPEKVRAGRQADQAQARPRS